ncbi:KOW motif-containing protein, partial [bacterium]|nr:KOW motif-containing protein [bacterium]
MKIKKGDIVQVMTGDAKYHGKRGKVLKVIPSKNQVIVE